MAFRSGHQRWLMPGLFRGLSLARQVDPCRAILADQAEELLLGEVRVQAMQVRSADAPDALARAPHRQFNQRGVESLCGVLIGAARPDGLAVDRLGFFHVVGHDCVGRDGVGRCCEPWLIGSFAMGF